MKLKNLISENSNSTLIFSAPKQQTVEKSPVIRAQRQYVLGQRGYGPRVYALTQSGHYVAEYSKYPSLMELAKTGKHDISDIIQRVSRILHDKLGIHTFDDQPSNIHVDVSSLSDNTTDLQFHIIDAGGMSTSGTFTAGAPIYSVKPGLKEFLQQHAVKFDSGESRLVYKVPKDILKYFTKNKQ